MMNTCVSLSCPFISYCRFYNFLVDRRDWIAELCDKLKT